MDYLFYDTIEELVNSHDCEVIDSSFNYSKTESVKLFRDSDLDLNVTLVQNFNASFKQPDHEPGELIYSKDFLLLKDRFGKKITIRGIIEKNRIIDGEGISRITATAQSVELDPETDMEGVYAVDWIENLDDKSYIWPNATGIAREEKTCIGFKSNENDLNIRLSKHSTKTSLNCAFLSFDKFKLYLIKSDQDRNNTGVNSGSIMYLGLPTEKERLKIRNCISFILGRPLICTGYTVFDNEWKRVSCKSHSPYTMGGSLFRVYARPPAPINEENRRQINNDILNDLITKLYGKYDECDFSKLYWAYWEADRASMNIAGVHYGACLEALQKSYTESRLEKTNNKLMEQKQFKKFKREVIDLVLNSDLDKTVEKIITNKITSLNQAPKSIVFENFLKELNLDLNLTEREAMKARNKAAHGEYGDYKDSEKQYRTVYVLRIIFNRILMKMIGAESYFDYSLIGFPIKKIELGAGEKAVE